MPSHNKPSAHLCWLATMLTVASGTSWSRLSADQFFATDLSRGTGWPASGQLQTPDSRFLEGLLERRLYMSADIFCRERWADSRLSSNQRVEVAIGWLRTCTLQALDLPYENRDPWWEKAEIIAGHFDQQAPDKSRGLLVRFQFALCQLDRVEGIPQVALEVPALEVPANEGRTETGVFGTPQHVRDLLRKTTHQLQQIEASISELLANAYQRRGRGSDSDGWTLQQLESLRRYVAIDLARARRLQAICYPAESDDRTNSLGLAIGHLRDLAASRGDEPETWQARLEMLVCLRLLGQFDQAGQLLEGWIDHSSPRRKILLQAEQMRLLLAPVVKTAVKTAVKTEEEISDAIQQALQLAGQLQEAGVELHAPASDVAILEVLLAAHQRAAPADALQLAQRASDQCLKIGRRHGPYWHRRATSLLGRTLVHSTSETQDRALLRYTARSLYLSGKRTESVTVYDRAARLASEAGAFEDQFELAATAAAIVGISDVSKGADRYRQLALSQKSYPRAAEVHLRAVGMAALHISSIESTKREAALEQYRTMLWEHLREWSRGPQADTARWWLGRLQMRDCQWVEAAAMLGQVTPTSDHYLEAIHACMVSYRNSLRQLEKSESENSNGDLTSEAAVEHARQLVMTATQHLVPVITGQDNRWPEVWSPLQRSIALTIGQMHLHWLENGGNYAEKLLAAALAEPTSVESEWRSHALVLWAVALVAIGQQERGLQVAREIFGDPNQWRPENVLTLVEVVRLRAGGSGREEMAARRGAARLIVTVADLVGPDADDSTKAGLVDIAPAWQDHPEWLAKWLDAQGVAWDLLGDHRRALAAIRRQVALQPDDGDALEGLATMLAMAEDSASWREAFSTWSLVERRSKPAGLRWWRARKARLELLKRLGKKDQADKLEQLTRILYPTG